MWPGRVGPVQLVDVECFKPPEEYKSDYDSTFGAWERMGVWDKEARDFMHRVFLKSGLSYTGTYLPPSINPRFCGANPSTGMDAAAAECKMCLCGAMEGLLKKTGLQAADIDILVTTCSIYCATPSLASMVVNHFKMRPDVQSYHLGGMGCANGVVAVNLVRDLLAARPNTNAALLTVEATTPALYRGTDRARLVTNTLFRMGGAAVLLSNKRAWAGRAKYTLVAHTRVHLAACDDALRAIYYSPDAEGHNGVFLGKNVVTEAGRALTLALTRIAPRVLTWAQLAAYGAHRWQQWRRADSRRAPYVPDMKRCVQHVCIHSGGAKVLDGIGQALRFDERYLAPSRAVLSDYGNVSSSTTWYSLAWLETCRGVRRGDLVMQIGVGSGIKCGVNVWRAARGVRCAHPAWLHRLTPEERLYLGHRASVDARYGTARVAYRLLFFLLMLLIAAAMHALMLHTSAAAQREL